MEKLESMRAFQRARVQDLEEDVEILGSRFEKQFNVIMCENACDCNGDDRSALSKFLLCARDCFK